MGETKIQKKMALPIAPETLVMILAYSEINYVKRKYAPAWAGGISM